MTRAQERLAAFAEWVRASSQGVRAPLGDRVLRGPYAVFVPVPDLGLPPAPADFHTDHLPLWVPAEQSVPDLPALTPDPPAGQGAAGHRLRHFVWLLQDSRFELALVGLADPAEPLRAALDRQLPGLDLAEYPLLFAPLWTLAPEHRAYAKRRLPLARP